MFTLMLLDPSSGSKHTRYSPYSLPVSINVFTGSVGYILNMTHNEKDMRNVVMISGVFSVLTAFGFTAVWGLSGAAWATGLSVMLQNMLAVYYVKLRIDLLNI